MSKGIQPRFTYFGRYIDLESAHGMIAKYENSVTELLKMLEDEPGRLLQTRLSSLKNEYSTLALVRYAVGYPIDKVRADLKRCAEAYLKVFELLGTEDPFPVTVITIDPQYPPGNPRAVVNERPLHPPGAKDYSVTNSKRNLYGVCVAMSAGDWETAARLASLAWDPPDASYIGPRSEICRPHDQHLAYAVKHLFADRVEECLAELNNVRTRPQDVRPREVANLVRALATDDAVLFYDAIRDLLEWHERWDPDRHNSYEMSSVEKFVCIWGTGLSAWALRRGLLPVGDLPQGNAYLPLDLIT